MGSLEDSTHQLKTAHDRMSRDLEAAAIVQQSMLPQAAPEVAGARFAWHYRPCDELAGDILNVFQLDDKHVGVYVADVSGHGVAASLLSVAISRVLSPDPLLSSLLIQHGDDASPTRIVPPAEVARELNQRFPMEQQDGKYFTIVYGVLNLETRGFRYTSAGHTPIVRFSANEAPVMMELDGMAIGWLDDVDYDERVLVLREGERLCLYSDGVPEAMSPANQEFGDKRLLDTLSANRSHPLDQCITKLLAKVESWCSPTGPKDDVSILAVEIM